MRFEEPTTPLRSRRTTFVLRPHTGKVFWVASVLLVLAHLIDDPLHRGLDDWLRPAVATPWGAPPAEAAQVVLVEADAGVGPGRWSPALAAARRGGARTVVLDLPAETWARAPAALEALAREAEASGALVLGQRAPAGRLEAVPEPLAEVLAGRGASTLGLDTQGRVVRIGLHGMVRDQGVFGLPIEAVRHFLGVPEFGRRRKGGAVLLRAVGAPARAIPLGPAGELLVSVALAERVARVGLDDLIAGQVPAATLADRLVVLPAATPRGPELVQVPEAGPRPRAEVLAAAVVAVLAGRVLVAADPLAVGACMALLALGVALVGWRRPAASSALAASIASGAWVLGALAGPGALGVVLPLSRPVGLFVLLGIAGALRDRYRTMVGVRAEGLTPEAEAQAALKLGLRLLREGKTEESLKYFQKVAGTSGPLGTRGNCLLALVMLRRGDPTSATQLVRSMTDAEVAAEEAYMLAAELEQRGQLETAHSLFSRLYEGDTTYRDVRERLLKLQDRLSGVTQDEIAERIVGRILDRRFVEVELLGRGGMGFVYRALDQEAAARPVALKVLSPFYANNEEIYARFCREAEGLAAWRHPNVVQIHDVFRENLPYYSMELLDAASLQDVLRTAGPLELDLTLRILRDVCAGLGYAHERGIVHRDVKPDNVMILQDGGAAKVIDFGIARFGEASEVTRTGQTMGTPAYMSPEQVRGVMVDGRADLYSVAVMTWEMLTGARPFRAMAQRVVEDAPPFPDVAGVPAGVGEVLARALARDPRDRQPSLADFLGDLDAAAKA